MDAMCASSLGKQNWSIWKIPISDLFIFSLSDFSVSLVRNVPFNDLEGGLVIQKQYFLRRAIFELRTAHLKP
jgi:hypothetical protein